MYDQSGITMSVAPYVDFNVARTARDAAAKPGAWNTEKPLAWTAQAGATGSMTGRDGVFGLPASELDRQLVEWKAPDALQGVSGVTP